MWGIKMKRLFFWIKRMINGTGIILPMIAAIAHCHGFRPRELPIGIDALNSNTGIMESSSTQKKFLTKAHILTV